MSSDSSLASIIEPDYMQGPNPDGPASHIDYNISIVVTYNMNLIIAIFQVIFEGCTDNIKEHDTEIPL
jgi:hypothetical protein